MIFLLISLYEYEQEHQIQLVLSVRSFLICCKYECVYVSTARTDYDSTQQTISLTPESASVQKVEIPVIPDDLFEADEIFFLLFDVRRSTERDTGIEFANRAQVTILNDDGKSYAIELFVTCNIACSLQRFL